MDTQICLSGKGVSSGIAIGTVVFLHRQEPESPSGSVKSAEQEQSRFEAARLQAMEQLDRLAKETAALLGEDNAKLFEIHRMMLEDQDFLDFITAGIQGRRLAAENAVWEASHEFAQVFEEMDDPYMKARAIDVRDVANRVADLLLGRSNPILFLDQPVILAADDFSPSETAQMPRDKVLALITRQGSANSHTSIFARTLGIPAVVGLGDDLDATLSGEPAAVDGATGEVWIRPAGNVLDTLHRQHRLQSEEREALRLLRGKPTQTKSGKQVQLYANIGLPGDTDVALEGDAEGIGLMRSEFLYLERKDYPDEETQYRAYRHVLEAMEGRPVIIRTLDIGADKQADYFALPAEENPAMGMRAIRICLTRPEVFKVQLRALYRASAHGNASIMFPMITSVDEIRHAKTVAAQVREELLQEGIAFDCDMPIGIMIETPASALISDQLAQEADFFSVGTNDLTQYTLALDRQNQSVSEFFDPHHPAVLQLIRMAADSAHRHGIWIGICGDLASDIRLARQFVDMGIDELSMAPSRILPMRRAILELD